MKTLIILFSTWFLAFFASGQPDCLDTWHEGEAYTYIFASGQKGNCAYANHDDTAYAALNPYQYENSGTCGACIKVFGPEGAALLKVVDQCPECDDGDIDMNPDAFTRITGAESGIFDIRWRYVPCPVEGNLQVNYLEGTNPYYLNIQLLQHPYPVKTLEYLDEDERFVTIPRSQSNSFYVEGGISEDKDHPGPYTFRVTDYTGQQIILNDIPYLDEGIADAGNTMPEPACPDCHGDMYGEASIDICGNCTGGNTGMEPVTDPALCPVTSTSPALSDNKGRAYPNPFQNTLHIAHKGEVQLFDTKGRIVLQSHHKDNINTENLPEGLYIIKITTPQSVFLTRMLKN